MGKVQKIAPFVVAMVWITLGASAQIVPKKYLFNQTYTYDELISTYKALESKHPQYCRLQEVGKSDGGKPLHLFVLDGSGDFSATAIHAKGKRVLFVLNGIHPGEPDGIDASVELAEEIILDSELRQLLQHVSIIIMPVYNVDGMLERGNTRANQNGPEESGFRGNARNLDLNRDCIKTDSRNAQSLARLMHEWQPEFFIDTHVSNGADYRYVLTLIPTAPDKLEESQKQYMMNELLPKVKENMKQSGFETAPYVYTKQEIPDSGILAFNDSPRYTTGFAALFGSLGFTTETHMLKPFPDRVKATKAFIVVMLKELAANYDKIHNLKKHAQHSISQAEGFFLNYENDLTRHEPLIFKGYEAEYKTGEATGSWRLWYNQSKPFEKEIPYYPYLRGKNFTPKPAYYLIPQAWPEIITKLQNNGVEVEILDHDTLLNAETYIIESYTGPRLYEGRAMVSPAKYHTKNTKIKAVVGDALIKTGTAKDKFLMLVLEPQSQDSYFQWGFFNSILEQKEYFSAYVFEDLAVKILRNNPTLQKQLEEHFSKNKDLDTPANRLDFIYKNSGYSDPYKGRYPVYRIAE